MAIAHGEQRPTIEPGPQGLWLGILVYRWVALGWMTTLAVLSGNLQLPGLAWASIVAAVAWTAWLTFSRSWDREAVRWFDLGLSSGLLLVSGVVMMPGDVARHVPFFATGFPAASAMTFGASSGPRGGVVGGLFAGFVLSAALALSRPINGVPFGELELGQVVGLGNGAFYYLAAGGVAGLISRALVRSADELGRANDEAMGQRERAARMAEREALGRQIHDSVLQVLALVNKRGRELGAAEAVPGSDVRELAEMAGQQETALRALIQREPDDPPPGTVSLRTVLQAATYGVTGIPVTVTTVDPLWLPAGHVEELSAAIREALENAVQHSQATQTSVFAEGTGDEVVVSVRDDGIGFEYDEGRLRDAGKWGMLRSMKGRIEELGGTMHVVSAPGQGTEVEFRVPQGGAAS
jgi:signal transduction histidine kinase